MTIVNRKLIYVNTFSGKSTGVEYIGCFRLSNANVKLEALFSWLSHEAFWQKYLKSQLFYHFFLSHSRR